MHSKKHVIAAAPLVLSLVAFTQQALAVTDITFCDEINQPGSYRVTQNLSTQSSSPCLLIDANDVTIDLQGHTITGNGSQTSTGIAVSPNSSLSNIEARNGTVTSFRIGINLSRTRGARVERMRVFDNVIGIIVGGSSVVTSNIVMRNGSDGIRIDVAEDEDRSSLITDNVASENGRVGILAGADNTVRGNLAKDNGSAGIAVGCPSLVAGNTTPNNNTGSRLSIKGIGCQVVNHVPLPSK